MYITDNKYEWSLRRIEELEFKIKAYQFKLEDTNNFFKKLKYKRKIKKLINLKYKHGENILEYERKRALENEANYYGKEEV